MSEEFEHMDASFQKMAQEFKVPYNPSYWLEVKSKLDDDVLDSAFKTAAGSVMVPPSFSSVADDIDNAFMDDAFTSAANNQSAAYSAAFFTEMEADLGNIQMDEAFVEGTKSMKATYQPHFWGPADAALQKEGLHYEYSSAYWNDAKRMLDTVDRKGFFLKWSAIATLLLLLSFGSVGLLNNTEETSYLSLKGIDEMSIASADYSNNKDYISNESLKEIVLNSFNNYNFTSNNEVTAIGPSNSNYNHSTSTSTFENTNSLFTINSSHNSNLVNQNRESNNEVDLLEDEMGLLADHIDESLINKIENSEHDISELNANPAKIEKFMLSNVHSLSYIGHIGVGNRYGFAEFVPTWRNTFGLEYMNTSYSNRRNFEFGGSFLINHIRQNSLGTERRVNVFTKEGDVNKSWYKLQLIDMIYANVNFLMNYKLDERNKLKFGIGVERLLSVKSNMSYKIHGDEEITTVNNNWGVKEGLNPFDLKVSLGYECQLSNRFSLQLMGNYGLLDRSDDEFLLNSFDDHELNITVGIKYTFMRNL